MKTRDYQQNPHLIEKESFIIIQSIIDELEPDYSFETPVHEAIIKRAIHTTADFDYMHSLSFTHNVIRRIQEVILNGGTIFTDTNMALSGINKKKLTDYGCNYFCYVGEPKVAEVAKEKGITRSMAAIEVAATVAGPKCFVLGNAPTAVYKILEMHETGALDVAAVVGVPVGFVGAEESKAELAASDIPAIAALGRKGGSNLAAAIVNAILYNMPERD